jgi:predicted ATPase/class 3 adenylate cyclase
MTALPTGTVTFFFSDIEGSTSLVEALGPAFNDLLERHHLIVRSALRDRGAIEMGTEGDSFFVVFPSATVAVNAAIDIQRALGGEEWPQSSTVRVRIGLHTGEARITGGTYIGLDVHRAARIMAAAHGGQVLISEATRVLAGRTLDEGIEFLDLGEHRLRGLSARERLYQVVAPGLPADFPPPLTLDATPNNLPTPPSELVGRDEELQTIHGHLESPGVRLLTLIGPGGIGKTRLAVEAAADHIDRFRDGVYFVDLAAARDTPTALQAIVQSVGVTVSSEALRASTLAEELHLRTLLLLLDNFEQVMPAANDVAELLNLCPKLKVMVTSREALRVRGEQLLPLAPLSLPNGDGSRRSAEELSQYEAVRLFVERARQARPDFELTDQNASAIAEICKRLDGLPLAIELAAARLKLFSPGDLTDRLRSRLEILRGGARDLPERHRTLRGTIEWSYELLRDDERAIFHLLSIFPSAGVTAVEDVASRIEALTGVDVVEALASLVDKSLARSVEESSGQRLSMLDTIREYAAERLESDPDFSAAARRAHADYFAKYAAAQHGEIRETGREAVVEALASELANLQTAWRHFVDNGDIAQLNKMLSALWMLHDSRGWYHGAVALTNDLLGVFSKSPPSPDRAEDEITLRISLARGLLALRGYTEEVEQLYRQALDVTDAAGAVPRRLPVLRSLASYHLYRGEIPKTLEFGQQILQLGQEQNDPSLEVEGHLLVGPPLAFMGDVRQGLEHLDRALELFDPERDGRAAFRLGPNPGVAANAVSALIHWLAGHPDTAAERARDAIELANRLHHPYSQAYATFHVTLLRVWNGQPAEAREGAAEVLSIAEEHDYQIWKALGLVLRGVATAALGRPEEGLAETQRGAALYENLPTPPVFWAQIQGLRARASAMAGRTGEALELLDRGLAVFPEGGFDSAALKIQKAGVLLSTGNNVEARSLLAEAFLEGRVVSVRMLQLIAGTGLARLGGTVEGRAAREVLHELYETFTEGFDTPHLVEARAALKEAATRPTG